MGKVTRAHVVSDWSSPSASGAFLPDSTPMAGQKLDARWTVLHLNRPYPQEFLGSRSGEVAESAFGMDLILPVDEYQKSTRAAKYGVMLIVLVFTVFFFVEVLQKMRIHPIQYLLVGLALCIFYSLLIAMSEHIGFGWSYIISAVAVMALVVVYARSVFKLVRAVRLLTMILHPGLRLHFHHHPPGGLCPLDGQHRTLRRACGGDVVVPEDRLVQHLKGHFPGAVLRSAPSWGRRKCGRSDVPRRTSDDLPDPEGIERWAHRTEAVAGRIVGSKALVWNVAHDRGWIFGPR